ncbi:hypothetical protein D7Z26_10385 [Cohnella endophytica]|uniref:Uncharacterized protein n=1 Tax=Cohnella endophytica TaxID=2419778 RepID=A0A494Y4U8_9BACL|nr:hypothetical protein D7Z26_10385 [Cohnella endophytica]
MKRFLKIIKNLFFIMAILYLLFSFVPYLIIDSVKNVFVIESISILLLVPFILLSHIKPKKQITDIRQLLIWIIKISIVIFVSIVVYKPVLNNTKDLLILLNSKPKIIIGTVEDNFERIDNSRFIYLDTDRYTHYIASLDDDFIIGKEYTLYYLPNSKIVIDFKINN